MYKLILSFLFMHSLLLNAQPLKINEPFPDISFQELFNTNQKQMHLSAFKNKMIIFDFWSTTCISCIQAFPKLDSLQKKFNNNLQILLVCNEPMLTVKTFFEKRKKIKIPDIPFICNDSVLQLLFPHKGFPAYAWLDADHRFRFITEGADVNAASIVKLINNEELKLNAHQSGHYKTPNIFHPEHQEKLLFTSTLTNCITGYQESLPSAVRKRTTGIHLKCSSATELYIHAFNENNRFQFNRVGRLITDFEEPEKYTRDKSVENAKEWRDKYAYNYQLTIPLSDSLLKFAYMKTDLLRFFQLKAEVSTVYKQCIILEEIPGKLAIKTKNGEPLHTFFRSSVNGDRSEAIRALLNKPFNFFTHNLGSWLEELYQLPFESNVDCTENIDIELSAQAVESLNITLLNKELAKYGLVLQQKEKPIPCLILSDK